MIKNIATQAMVNNETGINASPLNIVTQSMLRAAMENNSSNIGDGRYLVTCYDYDGTILKQKRLNAGETFTLPSAPIHDRIVFQTWSSSSPINADGQTITVNSDIAIGAVYTTISGNCEFDVSLTPVTGLTVTFQNLTGMTSINWGDGITNNSLSHTYTNYGNYTIQVIGVTAFGGNIFDATLSVPNFSVISARFTGNVSLGYAILSYCQVLQSVIISNDVTTVDGRLFYSCYMLKFMVIPPSITILGDYTFGSCYSLPTIVIPYTVTGIGQNIFGLSYCLTRIILPSNITEIPYRAFNGCYTLKEVICLAQNVDFRCEAFYNRCIILYDFSHMTNIPPQSGNFDDMNGACKIVVSDSLYNEIITPSQWGNIADYIYKASDIT